MLGLQVDTDPRWVEIAAANMPRVLVDHAHCEMKAASNALSLSARCLAYPVVTRALVEVAEEELRHLRRVLDELERRRIPLAPPEEDWYAAELRRRVSRARKSAAVDDVIVDRLLVGALIEARSCERFKLLSAALSDREPDLAAFYHELFTDEARHHRKFCDLAETVSGGADHVRERLALISSVEAGVVAELRLAATIHG